MKDKNPYIVFCGMGMELIGLILTAVILGRYTDQYMGWNNYALIGYSILGLVSWLYHLIKLLKVIEQKSVK